MVSVISRVKESGNKVVVEGGPYPRRFEVKILNSTAVSTITIRIKRGNF